jgi:hypothetical protein
MFIGKRFSATTFKAEGKPQLALQCKHVRQKNKTLLTQTNTTSLRQTSNSGLLGVCGSLPHLLIALRRETKRPLNPRRMSNV